MRVLVISDIHSNLAALEAVLHDTPDFDEVWCLGDIVGYGPEPNACIERVRGLAHTSLAGNHDWAVLGKVDLSSFNAVARAANEWTQQQLTSSSQTYLSDLPASLQRLDVALAHASPREPVWEYVIDTHTACQNFSHFSSDVCLVGHTHVPVLFQLEEEQRCKALAPPLPQPFELDQRRAIINPGSVGQPRDGDPRPSYALFDTDERSWTFRRVAYPVETTQELMRARGLPRRLIDRLGIGR